MDQPRPLAQQWEPIDDQFDAAMEALTAPGGPFETAPFTTREGRVLPALVKAPPSIPAYLAHFCTEHGDKPFLVDGNLRLTFAETHVLARELASGLIAIHGVTRGQPVGIAARNSANWILAWLAITFAGGCATLINAFGAGEEMCEAIKLAGCRLVVADEARAARLEGCGHGATLVPMRHDCSPRGGLAALLPEEQAALPDLTGDDLATILFTSGSTGKSKAALSDHRAVVHATMNYFAQSAALFMVMSQRGQAPADQPATLVAVPLFHVTGEIPLFLQSFALGRKLVLMPRWDAGEALRLIEAERCTYFVGVPLMTHELATHPDRERFDLSSCKTFAAGGSARPPEHVEELKRAMPNAFPMLGYGLTETNAVGCGTFNESYLARPESTGRASRPLVELAILGEDGEHLPLGMPGEVALRTICSIREYLGDREATDALFTADGFVRTGDIGVQDADGYLTIVDRKKDIIIRGGENIACIEVEAALYAHPAIAEAAVYGVPDPRLGEVPVAAIHCREGQCPDDADLRSFLAERLAPFKLPVAFRRHTDPLPRLGTEKIDKVRLRASDPAAIAK